MQDEKGAVEGAAGESLFEHTLLHKMIWELDRSARNSKPFCMCAMLLLGPPFGVLQMTQNLSA